ncbi:MAG TPA: tetratricopeptide repeat protein [Luteibacter sp.]|jgi:tetratricopeptide (TPR) repeat protein|nr:tetratricopeptide repeat protein [Luteibacter sp.]
MTDPAPELDEAIYAEVERLSAEGDALAEDGNHEEAKARFLEALQLLPKPHGNWVAATWLYVAIGDMQFQLGDAEGTKQSFETAVQCPDGLGNPFIHLRLGQANLDLGNADRAADELTRAYMGAGMDIFMEDDPKYLDFLQTRIEL